jgi:carbonic anhydrase/acetyltransferase-like protein (isoleucine patch superfamily)
MVMGVPAKVRRALTAAESEHLRTSAAHYVDLSRLYKEESI